MSSNLFSNPRVEGRLKKIEAAKVFTSTGGKNRAMSLSPEKRSEIASKAAKTRWQAYP